MKIEIICNEKGTGKTTFALNNYSPHKYFTKDMIDDIESSNGAEYLYCIIDSVDSIPTLIFNNIMDNLVSSEWKSIVLIFDLVKTQLMDCPNFNMIWECGFLPRNYKYANFIASKEDFYNFFQEYYLELDKSLYDHIIEITDYNFVKIDRLMFLNHLHTDNVEKIDIKALAKYIDEIIQIKYKDIPDADILLQKASIIGEQFVCDALESPSCFGYEAASAYIKQMEEMHGFVRSCININSKYEFISYDIYQGIFDSITNENKISWIKILEQYYKSQYERCTNLTNQLSILNSLNNLYKLLPTYNTERKDLCFLLLYHYRKVNKTHNALEIAKEIIEYLETETNVIEYAFVQNYQIKTYIQLGEYKQALKILQNIHNAEKYAGSKMLIKYYYAYCLFQTGNIDLSYTTIMELVNYLKNTSGSNNHSQELFCLTYSLVATIQNHLGLDDNGMRYFHLALNNASSKLKNKTYFFDILKKCDMFYEYEHAKENLEKCVQFYEQHGNWNSAGEVFTNLATEMMFQDCEDAKKIKQYFEKALSYFSQCDNEKLAYAKNNYGIYFIMVENDIKKGLIYFKEALLIGLTDFTYMSIYLNICMCYILLGNIESDEFDDAYIHFKFAQKKLNQRQHTSKYENIYQEILCILIDEHQGKNVEPFCEKLLNALAVDDFFVPLLKDIIKRNRQQNDSIYKDNSFFYMRMNQLHCFLAEFRFWE
ncbi:MAG: hypothetical protein II992_13295 [Lachnospiraceae bacterium]|nr:hypothetical protein [Lachnospiraceae bacterium]MBQ4124246.1 hypothetical protein [bacterium]MBQ6687520.1 hypothetical protein [Bacilli bacterium]